MSSLGQLATGEAESRSSYLHASLAAAGTFFHAWRRNLPEGWWVSLACAFFALFYTAIARILIVGFA